MFGSHKWRVNQIRAMIYFSLSLLPDVLTPETYINNKAFLAQPFLSIEII